MRALGAIREARAVGALTEQLAFYKKGEGAWSALDALAQIGAPASVPLFKERLLDKDPFIRRAAAEGLGARRRRRSRSTRSKRTPRPTSPRWSGWRRRSRCRSSGATTRRAWST